MIKQFNKMKKKFIILPVVAMLMVCGFSACSQDDDLLEYDLGNDEVATLAKRSMPRNGEVITPPTPPKEDEEDVPRRIELGSADFYEVRSIPVLLFDNMGTPFFTSRPGGIGGTITVFAVEEGNNQPAHFDASLSFDGEDLKGNITQISRPQKGIISVEFIAYIYNDVLDDIDKIIGIEGWEFQNMGVNVEIDPDFDLERAFN